MANLDIPYTIILYCFARIESHSVGCVISCRRTNKKEKLMSEKKPLSATKPEEVICLKCSRKFTSPDKRHVRICPSCRNKKS